MVIVQVTEGKHASVDYSTIFIFDNVPEARKYCEEVSTGAKKYWKKAEIIVEGSKIELSMPEGDY